MIRCVLAVFLVLRCSLSACAYDDTDETWRKIDPALGIVAIVGTGVPQPPLFEAHFEGHREKEFILYQWEPEICNISVIGTCLWHGGNRWKRVLGISSRGGGTTGKGKVDCRALVILTGWYKDDRQVWVQAKSDILGYIPPAAPAAEKTTGVVAGFDDDSGGHGAVEFIYGCP